MKEYYAKRAPVYDRVYQYPERQDDLDTLKPFVSNYFNDRRVLEIAAGTGYWTQYAATHAQSICAVDGNLEPLQELKKRTHHCEIETVVHDAYALAELDRGPFDAGFAALWFSHIPIERRGEWLDQFHATLAPGARVLLMDNSHAQTVRLPITRTDVAGNTYQNRTTDAGESFEVLKNFPSEAELTNLLPLNNYQYLALEHFWYTSYTV